MTTWTPRPSIAEPTWGNRTPEVVPSYTTRPQNLRYSPWISTYYPWLETSYPWLSSTDLWKDREGNYPS